MKRILCMLLISIGFICLTSQCKPKSTEVEKNSSSFKRVDKITFKDILSKDPLVQLVDVRTPGEYKKGTINNAVNIDFLASDFQDQLNALDKSKPILIFCQSGGRSAKTLKLMKNFNFTSVFELEGGYSNYK